VYTFLEHLRHGRSAAASNAQDRGHRHRLAPLLELEDGRSDAVPRFFVPLFIHACALRFQDQFVHPEPGNRLAGVEDQFDLVTLTLLVVADETELRLCNGEQAAAGAPPGRSRLPVPP